MESLAIVTLCWKPSNNRRSISSENTVCGRRDTILKKSQTELQRYESKQVFSAGKNRLTVRARSLLCYWAVRECGMSMASLAGRLGISITAVSQSVERGERIAKENGFVLFIYSNV